jgi:hypothetical protein
MPLSWEEQGWLTLMTQECSRLAFAKRGRSLQASDLTEEVHAAFMTLFGEVDGGNPGGKPRGHRQAFASLR